MNLLDPSRAAAHPIIINWRENPHLLRFKDAYARSERRWNLVGTAAQQESVAMNQYLNHLRGLRDLLPAFFAEFDYDWAFDKDSYFDIQPHDNHNASENLRLQLFLLRHLAQLNEAVSGPAPSGKKAILVCARHVRNSDFSPSCKISKGYGYVMVPSGFARISHELLLALRNLVANKSSSPAESLSALCEPLSASLFQGFAIPFVARALAKRWSTDYATQEGAEAFLYGAPPFAGTRLDISRSTPDSLESALNSLVLTAALNHEIGHLRREHDGSHREESEYWADLTSNDLSMLGWGWLSESGITMGIPDPVWMLMRPMLFFWVADCIARLELAVSGLPGREHVIELLERRKKHAGQRLEIVVNEVWAAFNVHIKIEHHQQLHIFQQNLADIARRFDANADILAAVQKGQAALEAA